MDQAHLYAETNSQQIDGAVKFFKIFGDFLKQKFKSKAIALLDIGSGCGKVLFEISVRKSGLKFSKIIGVDKSDEMLKYAQEVYGSDGRISFYYMDVEGEIPEMLRYQQFDMVSSFYCLHWIQDINNAFQNIYKLLNNNGLFCCVFLLSTKVNDIWDILAKKYSSYMKNWRTYYTPLWSLENAEKILQKCLEDCNFKVIQFHDIKNEKFKFRDLENYAKMLETVNPCFNSMPERVQKEFTKDMMHEICSMKEDELYVVPLRIMYFVAEKCQKDELIIKCVLNGV